MGGIVTIQLVHEDLSERIIGAAMAVLNALRPGFDKKLYERALVIELRKRSHTADQQKQYPVYYEEQQIGTLVPDSVVDAKVIVDPKVVSAFNDEHMTQMIGYLAISGLELVLLLNFKFSKFQWKRIVRQTGRL